MKASIIKIVLLSLLFSIDLYAATGDSFNHAKSVSVNSTTSGRLKYWWGNGYEYYYKFTPSSSGVVHIYTTGLDSDTDADLYDNRLIASDGSYKKNINITQNVSANTTYYLNIYNYANKDSFILHIDFSASNSGGGSSNSRINTRPFTKISINGQTNTNIYGDILVIGNQLLCQNSSDGSICQNPTVGATNNSITQHKVRIDTSSGAPSNNSMARLDLQPGDTIIWAGLYWSARLYSSSINHPSAANISMKVPGSTTYKQYTSQTSKYNWYSNGYVFDYACMADVTADVSQAGAGQYYVGGIQASNGSNKFASWALLVVVQNDAREFRNISIYDGFQAVYSGSGYPDNVTVQAHGFLTPKSGPVSSDLIVYTGESESGLTDGATLTDKSGIPHALRDAYNDPSDVFNASISTKGVFRSSFRNSDPGLANPNFQNVIGTDIDKLSVNFFNNLQTDTNITISSGTDRYTLNMFALSTQLYVPNLCYDYAYKQYGRYFTEDNNGTNPPKLTGSVVPGEPVTVSLFIRNLVDSDIAITNMEVNITDINTSQVTYIRNTTKVAHNSLPQSVPDTSLTVSDGQIKEIPIGTITSNDLFYVYYDLDPLKSNLDDDINATLSYTLTVGGTSIPYTTQLGSKVKMCSDANFVYAPAKGIFNIVHSNYYDLDVGGSHAYYNLPTQVVKREGNFKVLSMDPNNLDALNPVATMVAVEMIDASAFHDTNASCMERASSISPRVWVMLYNDTSADHNVTSAPFNQTTIANAIAENRIEPIIASSSDFYATARENAAFRVSYNLTTDGNDNLVKIQPGQNAGEYQINYTELVQNIGTCSRDMDGNTNNTDTVATYCGNASNHLTAHDIATCMECIYGYNTRFVCSRDNFAVRPEAFLIQLNDQNQTYPSLPQVDITTLHDSGSAGATAMDPINLAAGYQYRIEVNATNHINNDASSGYTKSFNVSGTDDDTARYVWNPLPTTDTSGCNDESNISIEDFSGGSFRFLNGTVDRNTSLDNVGRYLLTIKDTTWTRVDADTAYMGHHTGAHFTNSLDCRANSSIVQNTNASMNPLDTATLNGCEISSNHSNTEHTLRYNDYNISFYPYKFDLNGSGAGGAPIFSSIRPNYQIPTSINNAFVYISDINNSNDENMSYHLNGTIAALGENNSTLSNFVNKCYALPLTISIRTTDRTLNDTAAQPVTFRARFHDINVSTNEPIELLDVNGSDTTPTATSVDINLTTAHFYKSSNGSIQTRLNLNYDRNISQTVNPTSITFIGYDVNCTAGTLCFQHADLRNDKTPGMTQELNSTLPIKFYYGRANTGKQRFSVPDDTPYSTNIYYEIYCYGGGCDTTLLPSTQHAHDIRWYINTLHSTTNDGNVSNVIENRGNAYVQPTNLVNNTSLTTVQLPYDGTQGYPYQTTMDINTSGWLIYDPDDANATYNKFDVEYYKAGNGWSGKHETNATTNTNGAPVSNRRTMW